jgi:putative ABC transport system ATP-binding protein
MIELTDIYKIYNPGPDEVRALDGISLTIEASEFVGIVGPSGSGKSTLMNIIGCLDVVDRGSYQLNGRLVETYSQNELARIRNRNIGFVFQSFNLIGRMTLEENVELPLLYSGVSLARRREKVAHALERVGIWERRRHTPNSVSGGQQQRAAIARALVADPGLILGDEPTGNLDSTTSAEILALLRELNAAGTTVVLITHDREVAAQTRREVHIRDGRIEKDRTVR